MSTENLTQKQYDGMLIDEYAMLKHIREIAENENAAKTISEIDRQLDRLKLKLKIIDLSDDDGVWL